MWVDRLTFLVKVWHAKLDLTAAISAWLSDHATSIEKTEGGFDWSHDCGTGIARCTREPLR